MAAPAALRAVRTHPDLLGRDAALQPHPARAGPVLFTLGIALILAATAYFLMRAVASTHLVGIGTAATLLGVAMLIVALGSLLPAIEDWFGGRREMRMIAPILRSWNGAARRRHRRAAARPLIFGSPSGCR